jgi:hypothetical protein
MHSNIISNYEFRLKQNWLDILVGKVALLLSIWEIMGSNFSLETRQPEVY